MHCSSELGGSLPLTIRHVDRQAATDERMKWHTRDIELAGGGSRGRGEGYGDRQQSRF